MEVTRATDWETKGDPMQDLIDAIEYYEKRQEEEMLDAGERDLWVSKYIKDVVMKTPEGIAALDYVEKFIGEMMVGKGSHGKRMISTFKPEDFFTEIQSYFERYFYLEKPYLYKILTLFVVNCWVFDAHEAEMIMNEKSIFKPEITTILSKIRSGS